MVTVFDFSVANPDKGREQINALHPDIKVRRPPQQHIEFINKTTNIFGHYLQAQAIYTIAEIKIAENLLRISLESLATRSWPLDWAGPDQES